MTAPCRSTHWLSTASAGSAFVSPVPSPKRPCRAGKCAPIRENQIPLPPAFHATSSPPSSAPAPPWPPRLRSWPHRRYVPYLRQAVSSPHLLHTHACPPFRKLERRHLVRRLFCLLLPRRHNRRLPLPSTTGMVPWSRASRCWEISQSIYVKVCTQYIIV